MEARLKSPHLGQENKHFIQGNDFSHNIKDLESTLDHHLDWFDNPHLERKIGSEKCVARH